MVTRRKLRTLLSTLGLYVGCALVIGYFGINAYTGNVRRNTNVSVNRDVDIDVNHGWYDNHPVATAAAVGTAVAVTAAAIGSIVYSLPPSCTVVVENGVQYNYCGGVYYQPMYSGSTVSYVVVNP